MTPTEQILKRAELGGGTHQPGKTPLAPACLRPYQVPHAQKILDALRNNRAALDGSDTGTGKMYVACSIAKQLGVVPMVIAPRSTLAEWHKVAARFGVGIEGVNYELIRGVRRKGKLAESNWGSEVAAGSGSRWRWHQSYEFMVFDEVHRCGGMTSLNSKLLIAAKRQADIILTTSATAANDPRQMKALGYALGLFQPRDFKWWLMKHGVEPGIYGGFEFTDDPIEQQVVMERIGKAIFPVRGSRMRKADIPGFPKTLVATKLIRDESGKAQRITAAARDIYQGIYSGEPLGDDEWEEQNGIDAGNRLAALMAARQQLELLRVPVLAELTSDYARTGSVIIFINFRATADALRAALATEFEKVPVIDGSNTDEEREDIKVRFQNNEFPVLIANIQAGGVGIGLHDPTGKVERTSLISPCWNPKDLEQVLGRPNRDGGAFSQQYITYFADTLEEQIASTVQQGLQNIRALNDALLNGVYA